jgi:hypothetical protein
MRRPQTLRRQSTLAAVFVAAATLAGCASRHEPIPWTAGLDGPRHATLEVRNNHRHKVDLVVIRSDGGTALRVGSIDPYADDGFRLPQYLNDMPVRVAVQCRVTGEIHESHEVTWQPTQRVTLSVETNINMTKLALR